VTTKDPYAAGLQIKFLAEARRGLLQANAQLSNAEQWLDDLEMHRSNDAESGLKPIQPVYKIVVMNLSRAIENIKKTRSEDFAIDQLAHKIANDAAENNVIVEKEAEVINYFKAQGNALGPVIATLEDFKTECDKYSEEKSNKYSEEENSRYVTEMRERAGQLSVLILKIRMEVKIFGEKLSEFNAAFRRIIDDLRREVTSEAIVRESMIHKPKKLGWLSRLPWRKRK